MSGRSSTKRPKSKRKKLVADADKYWSRYVRLRDCKRVGDTWVGTCITCSKTGVVAWLDEGKLRFTKGWDCGHFIGRSNFIVRWDEMNTNLQCAFRCNKMRSGELVKYEIALMDKYGDEVPAQLKQLVLDNRIYKPLLADLEQTIHDAQEYIRFLSE